MADAAAGLVRGKRLYSVTDMTDATVATPPSDADVLDFDGASQKWTNKKLQVDSGGTGVTSLTANSLVVSGATATAALAPVPAGSAGDVLCGDAPPRFVHLQGDGTTVSVTSSGASTITVARTGILGVPLGGTGLGSVAEGVPLCSGTGTASALQPATGGCGTLGQVLASGGAGALPTFKSLQGFPPLTIASTGGNLAASVAVPFAMTSGGTSVLSLANANQPLAVGTGTSSGTVVSLVGGTSSFQPLVSQGTSSTPAFVPFSVVPPMTVATGSGNVVLGLSTPLAVANGGIGADLTAPANQPVVAGASSQAALSGMVAATQAGQLVVSHGTASAPTYQPFSGSGGVTTSSTGGALAVSVATPFGVAAGGTALSSFSANNALLCSGTTGTGSLQIVTAAASSGMLLISRAGTTPAFKSVSGTAPVTATPTGTEIDVSVTTPIPVTSGGTGVQSFAAGVLNQPLLSAAAGTMSAVLATTQAGRVLISQGPSPATPSYQQFSPAAPVTCTSSGTTITFGVASPIDVQYGGSAVSSFSNANQPVCSGATGTSALSAIAAATAGGMPLVSQGAGTSPLFRSFAATLPVVLSSTGSGVAYSFNSLGVAQGATGTTSFANIGQPVVTGAAGTSALSSIAPGTAAGSVLVAHAAPTAPTWQGWTFTAPVTGTAAGTGVTLGANNIPVQNGGTGVGSFVANTPVCAGAASATASLQSVAAAANVGYVLVSGGSGAVPSFQALSPTDPVTVTGGGGNITIAGPSTQSQLAVQYGGTGTGSFGAAANLLLASGASSQGALQFIAAASTSNMLLGAQSGALPTWVAPSHFYSGNVIFVTRSMSPYSYTPNTSLVRYCVVEGIGAGGAGGGCVGATGTTVAVGGGGGSGEIFIHLYTASTLSAGVTCTIGAGGTGVSGNTGNAGGNTSFGTRLVANGGAGGVGATSAAGNQFTLAGVGGSGGASGSSDTPVVRAAGWCGDPGYGSYVDKFAIAGEGASSRWGTGGRYVPFTYNATGNAANGYGSGGAGTCNYTAGSSKAGGAGADGLMIITEYG